MEDRVPFLSANQLDQSNNN